MQGEATSGMTGGYGLLGIRGANNLSAGLVAAAGASDAGRGDQWDDWGYWAQRRIIEYRYRCRWRWLRWRRCAIGKCAQRAGTRTDARR
jgi:hypothetical protein